MKVKPYMRMSAAEHRRLLVRYVCILMGVVVLAGIGYSLFRRLEVSAHSTEAPRGDLSGRFSEAYMVSYDGRKYIYNNSLLSVLFMGVDRSDDNAAAGYRNGGQADFLMLLLIDTRAETITQLQIDRDTMAEITVLGVLNNKVGTRSAQICLSHGFGDGKKQSCELTLTAVQQLLLGVEIDYYVALDLNAISTLNDALGGVTVTLEDDFTKYDPDMTKGREMTLIGDQSEVFVRFRYDVGDGTNASRQRRQQVYMAEAFKQMTRMLREDQNFVGDLFDQLGSAMVTNMSRGRMINVAYKSRDYRQLPPLSLAGEHTIGADGFVEFHVDEQAMEHLVMDTFFEKVSG